MILLMSMSYDLESYIKYEILFVKVDTINNQISLVQKLVLLFVLAITSIMRLRQVTNQILYDVEKRKRLYFYPHPKP